MKTNVRGWLYKILFGRTPELELITYVQKSVIDKIAEDVRNLSKEVSKKLKAHDKYVSELMQPHVNVYKSLQIQNTAIDAMQAKVRQVVVLELQVASTNRNNHELRIKLADLSDKVRDLELQRTQK